LTSDESAKGTSVSNEPSRIKRFFAALAAGAVLDAVDLVTFGPIGLGVGLLAGAAVGWWLGPSLGLPARRRGLGAVLSGLYCMTPLTAFLPLASLSAALASLTQKHGSPSPGRPVEADPPDAVGVEFRTNREERETR
jgi:hypothetical protein